MQGAVDALLAEEAEVYQPQLEEAIQRAITERSWAQWVDQQVSQILQAA